MKKIKLYLIILISILSIMNVAIILKYKSLRGENILLENSLNNNLFSLTEYEDRVFQEQFNENIKIDSNITLVDENDSTFSLNEILKNGNPKLFIRNYETGCSSCFEQELQQLIKISSFLDKNDICIVTTHNNSRKLNVFKKTYNINFETYYCDTFNLPYDMENKLYVFMTDSTFIIKHFFIPYPYSPTISEKYYSSIQKRYFNNKTIN